MKILSIILSLCLTMNVMAASGTVTEFERALDEYQFALTVEWDQKDQLVYERETKAFFEKLSTMMAVQGLSQSDVLSVVEKKMSDKKAVEALKLKLSLADIKTHDDLASALKEHADSMYSKGASWNGDIVLYGLGIIAVAAIGYSIWFHATHDCVSYNTQYTCTDASIQGTQCYYDQYCELYEKKE